MLSWNQVVEVSRADARQDILDLLDGAGFAATSWQVPSLGLALVEIGAELWSRGSKVAVFLKSMGINETSAGEALTKFSKSHYANEREDARATQRLITLECTATEGPYTFNVGDVIATNGTSQYANIIDPDGENPTNYPVTLASGGEVTLLFEADTPGTAANAEDGAVMTLVTTFAGVTITDDTGSRDGTNDEADDRLQARNESKWALLTRFGLIDDAVEALALAASEAVTRVAVRSDNPNGPGTFIVYLGGDEGGVGVDDVSDVYALISRYVMNPGDHLFVENAPEFELDIAGQVYFSSAYNWVTEVKPAVLAALEAWRRTIPFGGFPYPSPGNRVPVNEIEHVIRSTKIGDAYPVKTVKLTTPSGDVAVPGYNHVVEGTWAGLSGIPV
jgi:hypothetical protein